MSADVLPYPAADFPVAAHDDGSVLNALHHRRGRLFSRLRLRPLRIAVPVERLPAAGNPGENTHRLLQLVLTAAGVRGTFFLCWAGWPSARPDLVKDIRARRGTEGVGSHGYWHRLAFTTRRRTSSRAPTCCHGRDVLQKTYSRRNGKDGLPSKPSFSITRRCAVGG